MIVAKLLDVPFITAFLISFIGNMVPIPFILLFIKKIFAWLRRFPRWARIIDKLEAYHGPLEPERRTCDIVQYGDPDQVCTGIVLSCCPTAEVIRKAAELGCNLIIGHEPLFYDGWNETDWLQDNCVYQAKKQLLDRLGIVVYRDHDHIHNHRPDGIFSGLAKMLGWEQYQETENYFPGTAYHLPLTTVRAVAEHVAHTMQIDGIRIIGDPEMPVERVAIVGHFFRNGLGQAKYTAH